MIRYLVFHKMKIITGLLDFKTLFMDICHYRPFIEQKKKY